MYELKVLGSTLCSLSRAQAPVFQVAPLQYDLFETSDGQF